MKFHKNKSEPKKSDKKSEKSPENRLEKTTLKDIVEIFSDLEEDELIHAEISLDADGNYNMYYRLKTEPEEEAEEPETDEDDE